MSHTPEHKAAKEAARIERRQQFDALRKQCRLRELPLAAIFPGVLDIAVPLSAINEETGHDNHAEMLYVIAVAVQRQPRRIFEFGTYFGRTTFHLARACPDATVTTLDLPRDENPWPYAPFVGTYFEDTDEARRIRQIRIDSRAFAASAMAGQSDLVWVDADHSYDGVRNDTEKAFQLLAPGGVIMWHDFGPDSLDLVKFVRDFTDERPLFRLRRTSVLLHIDGVDPLAFEPLPVPFTKVLFKGPK